MSIVLIIGIALIVVGSACFLGNIFFYIINRRKGIKKIENNQIKIEEE